MKVLLVCDRKNWAYDAIARALVLENSRLEKPSPLQFEIFYLKQQEKDLAEKARISDRVFFLGWQLVLEKRSPWLGLGRDRWERKYPFIPPEKILTGIHSHHSWDGIQTLPDHEVKPPQGLVEALRQFRGVNAVSGRLTRLFQKAGLERCIETWNGVDPDVFSPITELGLHPDTLTVGFSGNRKHDFRKGVSLFIEPLEKTPWLRTQLSMPQGDYVPLEKMPGFYQGLDVYLCASSSEGFSLSVLEAAGCGRALLSTRVGGSEELVRDGVNGIYIERNLDVILAALKRLHEDRALLKRLGAELRQDVLRNFTWKTRAQDWFQFILGQK